MEEMTVQDMEIARLVLDGQTHVQIAAALGVCVKTISRRTNKPAFLAYVRRQQAAGATKEIKELDKVIRKETAERALPDVSKANLLAKLWEFVCIDPALTKHDTSGQRESLSQLWDKMGYKSESGGAPTVAKTHYISKWNRTEDTVVPISDAAK